MTSQQYKIREVRCRPDMADGWCKVCQNDEGLAFFVYLSDSEGGDGGKGIVYLCERCAQRPIVVLSSNVTVHNIPVAKEISEYLQKFAKPLKDIFKTYLKEREEEMIKRAFTLYPEKFVMDNFRGAAKFKNKQKSEVVS